MPALFAFSPVKKVLSVSLVFALAAACLLVALAASAQVRGPMSPAPQPVSDDTSPAAPQTPAAAQAPEAEPEAEEESEAKVPYDPAIFLTTIPADQLALLKKYEGMRSGDVMQDKAFRKITHSFVPDCIYHYGSDMSLPDALDKVIEGSPEKARIRDGRYFLISGKMGPYLVGKGFLWVDTQTGIGLGGFYFHPTNGEPTPVLNVFSKQVKEKVLEMGQLPPAFALDVSQWTNDNHVNPVLTRYFISGRNEKILLAHDEDFCRPADGIFVPSFDDCEKMDADASDLDMSAAYYLEQVHHATNATAWMIEPQEQIIFVRDRDQACRIARDPLACHVRMTREHTRTVVRRGGGGEPPVPRPTAPHR
ncbi:MAG TPA: hypothetical protein VNU84_06410 [Candidatus Acidoferrum sp.]|jgi:hypothetical protein|nr:hypothetical protein [Candidatus Acidoferrum sp.]